MKSFGEDTNSSVKGFGEDANSSVKASVTTFGKGANSSVTEENTSVRPRKLGKTAQTIIDLVIADALITEEKMAEKIGVSKRAIEMQIAKLKAQCILIREGADRGGYWRIIVKPEIE